MSPAATSITGSRNAAASPAPARLRSRFCPMYRGQKMGTAKNANSSIWGRHPATSATQRLPKTSLTISAPRFSTGVLAAESQSQSPSISSAAPQRMAYS